MSIGNMHKEFGEDRTCGSRDKFMDRQTHAQTVTQRDMLITVLCSPICGGALIVAMDGESLISTDCGFCRWVTSEGLDLE